MTHASSAQPADRSGEGASRRAVMIGAAVGLTLGAATATTSATPASAAPATAAKHTGLIRAAADCIAVAEVCQAHCIRQLGAGDTSMKLCMSLVAQMLPVCGALVRVASIDGARLSELAKVCTLVLADCEAECRKHEGHHTECRDCAEACAACIKACKTVTGA